MDDKDAKKMAKEREKEEARAKKDAEKAIQMEKDVKDEYE